MVGRIITESGYNAGAGDHFSKLSWDSLLTRRKKHKAKLMFNTINELTPPYLHDLFKSRSTGCNLRNSEHTLSMCQNRELTTINEVLVTVAQCCGMSCLKVYEQYTLLVNLKEKLTHYLLYMKRTPARQACKSV